MKTEIGPCTLIQESGPGEIGRIRVTPARPVVIGRSASCDVHIEDPEASISRRHLEVKYDAGRWFVTDLGSRNGTELNGHRIDPDMPTALNSGDLIVMGSWSLRVLGDPKTAAPITPSINENSDTTQIERVKTEPLAKLESRRLAALLTCADEIHLAESPEEAAMVALRSLVESTGYMRGAYLIVDEHTGGIVPVAFNSRRPGEAVKDLGFSRSLLDSARDGEIVQLSGQDQSDYGHSVSDLQIHSALCVPVKESSEPIGYLYLDARGQEGSVELDSSSFAGAMAHLLGLAIGNLNRKRLEIEQVEMRYDLDIAANAQRLLLPPETGRAGAVEYTMLMRPGRMVAGDLFGIVELADGRVCVFLGDVAGKGAGAAILMAATQSYLHAQLEIKRELRDVMNALNRFVTERSTGQFVTMWIGIIDPGSGAVEFVDCGHGHWLLVDPGGAVERPGYTGDLVVGIDPDHVYGSETVAFAGGNRLVLFSDGVVEQTEGESDEQYGLEQAARILDGSASHAEDVKRLFDDVMRYAQSEDLRDDTTIASIGLA